MTTIRGIGTGKYEPQKKKSENHPFIRISERNKKLLLSAARAGRRGRASGASAGSRVGGSATGRGVVSGAVVVPVVVASVGVGVVIGTRLVGVASSGGVVRVSLRIGSVSSSGHGSWSMYDNEIVCEGNNEFVSWQIFWIFLTSFRKCNSSRSHLKCVLVLAFSLC